MASSALDFLVDEHDFTAPFPRARAMLAGLPPSAATVPHAVHGLVHVRGPVTAPTGSTPLAPHAEHGPVHVHGPVAAPQHAPVPYSSGPLLPSSTMLP